MCCLKWCGLPASHALEWLLSVTAHLVHPLNVKRGPRGDKKLRDSLDKVDSLSASLAHRHLADFSRRYVPRPGPPETLFLQPILCILFIF